MQKIITDLLVQDYLQVGMVPNYQLDPCKVLMIDNNKLIKEHNIKKNITVPLIPLEEVCDKLHHRKIPNDLNEMMKSLILEVALKSSAIEVVDLKQGLAIARNFFINKEMYLAALVMQSNLIVKNAEFIFNESMDRCTVVMPIIPENTILCLPDPEFLGALAFATDNKSIGAFAILEHTLVLKLKE